MIWEELTDQVRIPHRAAKEAIPITLSQGEISEYVKRFTALDGDKKGFVTVNDLRNSLKVTIKLDVESWMNDLLY